MKRWRILLVALLALPLLGAYLPEQDRQDAADEFMRDESRSRTVFGDLTKAEIREAINGLDDYIEDNKIQINNAIPQPARAQLTTKQKARLLIYVVERRYLKE